jgi:hypothetical protein
MNAVMHNPANRVSYARLLRVFENVVASIADAVPMLPTPEHLAALTTKYWRAGGVHLTVGFVDSPAQDLKERILSKFNAWGQFCNAKFVLTNTDPQIRVDRGPSGYWSYLGTDILMIPRSQPTMNLQGFTMQTSEAEFNRVVKHEIGHSMGFPHEHARPQLVARLDRNKTINYFRQQYGWSEQQTIQQVLTPISESSIRGTANADADSIMCYQLPGSITIDGQPIRGGVDIDPLDAQFAGELYPLPVPPPPPPPPSNGEGKYKIDTLLRTLYITKQPGWDVRIQE